jgi:hypothetical protein
VVLKPVYYLSLLFAGLPDPESFVLTVFPDAAFVAELLVLLLVVVVFTLVPDVFAFPSVLPALVSVLVTVLLVTEEFVLREPDAFLLLVRFEGLTALVLPGDLRELPELVAEGLEEWVFEYRASPSLLCSG